MARTKLTLIGLTLGFLLPALAISCGEGMPDAETDPNNGRDTTGLLDWLGGGKSGETSGLTGTQCMEDDLSSAYPRFIDGIRFQVPLRELNLGCAAGLRLKAWVHSGDSAVVAGVGGGQNSSIHVVGVGKDLQGTTLSAAGYIFDGTAAEGSYLVNWTAKARYFTYKSSSCTGLTLYKTESIGRSDLEVVVRRKERLRRGKLCVTVEASAVTCDDALLGREEDPSRKGLCDEAKGTFQTDEESLKKQCEESTMDVFPTCC